MVSSPAVTPSSNYDGEGDGGSPPNQIASDCTNPQDNTGFPSGLVEFPTDRVQEVAFKNEGTDKPIASSTEPPAFPHREISNQSTIDSASTTLSGNSRSRGQSVNDPQTRRPFGRTSSTGGGSLGVVRSIGGASVESEHSTIDKNRRVNLLLDQCETVRFPFKRKLILANMNLSYDDVPVEHICSDRLASTLYKLSLSGNPLLGIPPPILKLNNLRILDLSQIDLKRVPKKWDLPALKKLNLSHNRIDEFLHEDVFRGLPELQHLDLYGNKLSEMTLPKDPSLTLKLEYIDLGYNNLTILPDELAQLHSLRTLKCMNNLLEIVPPSVCRLDLRVLDVSSNPLVQPPVETCERGIHSMRRYYHCLQLEESRSPDQQQSPSNKTLFRKMKHEVSSRKKKSFTRKSFPASLCRPKRCVSEPATSSASLSSVSTGPNMGLRSSAPISESHEFSNIPRNKIPVSSDIKHDEGPPLRSVSMRLSEGQESSKSEPEFPTTTEETSDDKGKQPQIPEVLIDQKASITSEVRLDAIKDKVIAPSEPLAQREESDFSQESTETEPGIEPGQSPSHLVGLKEAEKVPGKITVNDTLKVIFVGMALSGKTSIIKRLIEGKHAVIPEKDERTIGVDIYEWDPKSANKEGENSLNTKISVDGDSQSTTKCDVDVKFSVWDFAGQHVYHATHELFFSSQSLYVLVWDMGANNTNTKKRRSSLKEEHGAFKLTYDSSDEEDDFFDSEQENRRTIRALEQDIDEKLQFWVDCIQSSAPGAAILPVASFDDYFGDGIGNEEATMRCKLMKERLQKHEERKVRSMKQRLEEYDSKFGAHSELSLRLRKLLCPFNRPKIIFGPDGPNSVVRVSSTNFTGFGHLTEKIVGIATGRERGGWTYPVFRGHIGARIPRMRLEVREVVRGMRDRFKVVEWGYFLDEVKKKGIDNADDVSDALHFLANIGELSYFGEVVTASDMKNGARNKKLSSLYDDGDLVYEDEESTSMLSNDYGRQNSNRQYVDNGSDAHGSTNSLELSEFVFLNPRWLVAAVACILRHDLTREIYEVRRTLRNNDDMESWSNLSFEGEQIQDVDLKTDVNYPVISAQDACLLWEAKKFTKKAAERALQYSNNRSVTPFDFLQRLLVRFGVFVPIDLTIKTCLGGKDYSRYSEYSDYPEVAASIVEEAKAPKFFFLPSLLGPGEPSEIWTFKTNESWKTTICHAILFPDGVPPGLMERITASVLSDLYTNTTRDEYGSPHPSQRVENGQLRIKETLCWRSAFFLRIGNEVLDSSTGTVKESVVEIFATLVDQDSHLCVASESTGVGMRRLIFSAKGQAGDYGSKIWKGGYMRVLKKAVRHVSSEYGGLEIEKQAVCPQCLARKPIAQASVWDHSTVESHHTRGDEVIRCRYGHSVDMRLITGISNPTPQHLLLSQTQSLAGEADIPVSNLLRAVVIVGIWDEDLQRITRAGSGFFVDKKRGLIVTAGHTLMDRNSWREVNGKIVIGIIPETNNQDDPIAVYRYFARIIAKDPSINGTGICRLDACVLQITTRMERDVRESGREIGEQPESLLMNNPEAMKGEKFHQLSVTEKYELDEAVRILGFNQGGEGLIGPGEELNRCADFARGYVVMKFAIIEVSEQALNRKFQPRSEIVVICPTIGGHSGGPCVNQQGEVIGILSRADPADRQRCYLVPSSEWKPLVKEAKRVLSRSK